LAHAAAAKAFVLAELGDIRATTCAKLVDRLGIAYRLGRRLRQVPGKQKCCRNDRTTTDHEYPLLLAQA
jgi:hypothetical protein